MNLLDEAWMPVRHQDGSRHWVAPHQLGDPRIAAFDACRPDFNGALAQFAIGLLQTCNPLEDVYGWREWLKSGPSPEQLRTWLEPVREAFVFDGNDARFMQDLELREGASCSIEALLIDSASDNAIELNKDHFVKRGRLTCLCSACAATALYALQLNAPEGGPGHLTSVRGGGPLTTLLQTGSSSDSLWTNLWLNVLPRGEWLATRTDLSDVAKPHYQFPWLVPQATVQKEGQQLAPTAVHPDHVFWSMPRPVRLGDMRPTAQCGLCGRTELMGVSTFVRRQSGLDYKGAWQHPLSPYKFDGTRTSAVRTPSQRIGYAHWAAWVLGLGGAKDSVEPAASVSAGLKMLRRADSHSLRLWSFGFETNQAKVIAWNEGVLPLFNLDLVGEEGLLALRTETGAWIAGADYASRRLVEAVQDAWASKEDKRTRKAVTLRADVSDAFWAETERDFYVVLKGAIDAASSLNDEETAREGRTARAGQWQRALQRQVMALFDHSVGAAPLSKQHPWRISEARKKLLGALAGDAIRRLLNLPVLNSEEIAAKKQAKTKSAKSAAPSTPAATA